MFKHLSLQTNIIIVMMGVIVFQLGLQSFISFHTIADVMSEESGKRALNVAQSIASMPKVIQLVSQGENEGTLQDIADKIRLRTQAQFIVIGDKKGLRYSHPNSKLIGEKMMGGDNERALKLGESYTSKAVGTLGPSLRGKTPIFNENNEVIGIVSVGFLLENIEQKIWESQVFSILLFVILIITGSGLSVMLARSVKKAILGFEPAEISQMYAEKAAIIESVREGIVAINQNSEITIFNQAAINILNLEEISSCIKKNINDVIPDNGLVDVLVSGMSHLDKSQKINEVEVIVNRVPIFDQYGGIKGVVSSFRENGELEKLHNEMSQLQEYSAMLRHQTHEYSNKLHTIAGLIQLESYDKAVELISSETSGYQSLLAFLISAIPDPIVAGCILGKYNRAKELNITLEIDRDSHFECIPERISKEQLVTVLGNLLDNAYQAVLSLPEKNRKVILSMTDLGSDIIFEVEDSGKGVPKKFLDEIFKHGFSTSGMKDKGIGLFLVKKQILALGGDITLKKSVLGGACFTVFIPKKGK